MLPVADIALDLQAHGRLDSEPTRNCGRRGAAHAASPDGDRDPSTNQIKRITAESCAYPQSEEIFRCVFESPGDPAAREDHEEKHASCSGQSLPPNQAQDQSASDRTSRPATF